MSRLTDWAKLPQEKRDEYNAKKRADYAKQNMDGWREARRRRATTPQENMLRDFLLAKTPHEKRQVIKTFNPYYFQFGTTLDARPTQENDNEQQ